MEAANEDYWIFGVPICFIALLHCSSITDTIQSINNYFPAWRKSYVTLDHKISHKGNKKNEIYTSYGSWTNKLSIDAWFVRIGQYGLDTPI